MSRNQPGRLGGLFRGSPVGLLNPFYFPPLETMLSVETVDSHVSVLHSFPKLAPVNTSCSPESRGRATVLSCRNSGGPLGSLRSVPAPPRDRTVSAGPGAFVLDRGGTEVQSEKTLKVEGGIQITRDLSPIRETCLLLLYLSWHLGQVFGVCPVGVLPPLLRGSWDLVRNANSGPSQTFRIRNSGEGAPRQPLTHPPGASGEAHVSETVVHWLPGIPAC